MPKGPGYLDYPTFERGYEALKQASGGFAKLDADSVRAAAARTPMSVLVLRCILGFTPSEWAYVACERTGTQVSQGFARSLDRKIRLAPHQPLTGKTLDSPRFRALVHSACQLVAEALPHAAPGRLHRLDKADTAQGEVSLRRAAALGVPYAMLLYERFLGRPFAGHRDSVSEIVGDALESAVEAALSNAGISFRKTKRAERIEGFDQAPDFIVPSEFNPQVVIEAKITEDDGTARDKVTRIQHLCELSAAAPRRGMPAFEVVACIGGRGFAVRREDMRKLLVATRGKVFTSDSLHRLVQCTRLSEFITTSKHI